MASAEVAAEQLPYLDFVRAKKAVARDVGLTIQPGTIHEALKPMSRDIVAWAIGGGRRAIFASFGLHKTIAQLELQRLVREALGGFQLQIAPLNVILEGTFDEDAARLGVDMCFVQSDADIDRATARGFVGQFITNYESVREGKIGAERFNAVSLDEADCLRGMGGTKTFREFMQLFPATPFKWVASATPSPNEYVELLAYAAFLGVMDIAQAKTRFFRRNSEQADELTLHPHKEAEFWAWVNSWACFVQRPSDLGYSDEGYELPPADIFWHEVPSDHSEAGLDGRQHLLLKKDAIGIVEASREKRDSIDARLAKMMELRAMDPDAHRIIWLDLERERHAVEAAIPGVASVWGSQPLDDRAKTFRRFKSGEARELATKPVIAGAGGNFAKHCWWEIFLGIGFKFRDLIQAIHRVQRFGQTHKVRIDLIYTEAEWAIRAEVERKWRDYIRTCERMSEIIRTHGLGLKSAVEAMERTVETGEADERESGPAWEVWRGDTILRTTRMASDSVGLITMSIPFSTQFEYTPSYNDLGHTSGLAEFFAQMDYLTPELLRVLQPGRRMAVHVKDRVVDSAGSGLGFRTIEPFHAQCIEHYRSHGFAYLGMVTIVTDVVRENAGTYRLGWTQQCIDASGMGVGLPEYLLLFRKAPTDRSNGYADVPVAKAQPKLRLADTGEIVDWDKKLFDAKKGRPVEGSGYSRARWQTDAAGYWRSSGDRTMTAEDLVGLPWKKLYRRYRGWSYATLYDHEHHVALMEAVESRWSLPPDFALMPVQSWHPDVWTDVARMRGANTEQSHRAREQHLCPLPYDIVDRAILNWSMPGELVFDPFGGLMTVPLRAVRHGRRGAGVELNPGYFADGVRLLREQDKGKPITNLFDLIAAEDSAEDDEADDLPEDMDAAA
jgi:hypothetical protein